MVIRSSWEVVATELQKSRCALANGADSRLKELDALQQWLKGVERAKRHLGYAKRFVHSNVRALACITIRIAEGNQACFRAERLSNSKK